MLRHRLSSIHRRARLLIVAGAIATTCAIAAAAGAGAAVGTTTAFLSYKGMVADVVGFGPAVGPDGQADGHFALTVITSAARTMTAAELSCGSLISDTDPATTTSSLVLMQGARRLNPGDAAIKIPLGTGTVVYDLFAADPGYFKGGLVTSCSVIARFADGSVAVSKYGPAPAAAPVPISTRPRLDGRYPVKLTVTRANATARSGGTAVGDVAERTWTFLPQCTKGACDVKLKITDGGTSIKVKLTYNGTAYVGSASTPLPGECAGKPFLLGDGLTGEFAWTAKVTAAKLMSGQVRATAITGTEYVSLVPTAAFKAAGCTRTSNVRQNVAGTRR